MLTIDVNGVKLEAETMKELNKLVKKEEKRQEAERKEAFRKESEARIQAYATLGKLASFRLSASNYIVNPERFSYVVQNRQLQVESLNGETAQVPLAEAETVLAAIMDHQGIILAIKISYFYSETEKEERWYSYGAYQGTHHILTVPAFVADQIEKWAPVEENLAA
jgi:hypothetical protein